MLAYEYKIKDAGLPNKNSIGSSSPNAIIAFVKQQIGPFLKDLTITAILRTKSHEI